MRKPILTATALVALLHATASFAADPADSQIRGALADIAKFEQEVGKGQPRASTLNRVKKLLGLTRQRLDQSPNQGDESWAEADQRLQALLAQIDALSSPGGAAASNAAPATQAAAPATTGKQAAQSQMISQDRVRIAKLKRDVESAIQSLDQAGPKPFQDPGYVADRERSIQGFRQSLDRYADFADDPDVLAAEEAIGRYEAMMAFGRDHAAKELAELGDVQAAIRAIHERLKAQQVPQAPTAPYADGAIEAWLRTVAGQRQAMAADHAALNPIKERAWLPDNPATPEQGAPYDLNDVGNIQAVMVREVRGIDESLQKFTSDLDSQVAHVEDDLAWVAALDPRDSDDQANAFLGEGRADEIRGRIAGVERLVVAAQGFDQMLRRTAPSDRGALLERVRQTAAGFEAGHATALEVVRLPPARSDDPELVEIARQTLANPDYAVGEIERLVVNAEKAHHEMETSEVEIDKVDLSLSGDLKLSGTETTWRYEWDQFQVATAEPEGGKHWIFYNTLKRFTSGGPTTPLNRWVLSGRFKGVEIPKANIPLD